MSSKRPAPKGKLINPHFWVFCEGKTEEVYVRHLRAQYRLPVEIIPKVAGCDISARYIRSFKQDKPVHEKDRDFLIYDADVPGVLQNLTKIGSATLIASNPCIELWFLLHYMDQKSEVSANVCIQLLEKASNDKYSKGSIEVLKKVQAVEERKIAGRRSRLMTLFDNPSTNFYAFIDALEEAKSGI